MAWGLDCKLFESFIKKRIGVFLADYLVKEIGLATEGNRQIAWAEGQMPVLQRVRERFAKEKPLNGMRIAACLHVTKETAVLARTLVAGGAAVRLCASNPLSTQDDVAAALALEGIPVFAVRGIDNAGYYECVNKCLDGKPNITIDDGADLISEIHSKRTDLIDGMIGGQEETTTGVIRLRAMAADGALKYPVIAVNDARTKMFFDNRFGTAQSTLDGIVRATDVLLAGKTFVVAGYGWCGRGIASRARGMGCRVVVTEVDPVKALEAHMEGFAVMKMSQAAAVGDVFVTATGDKNVISTEHFPLLKDGAIVANSGHFNVEVDVEGLKKLAVLQHEARENVVGYTLPSKKKVFLLAEGRLVNLACATGHPSEVMQMSFAVQALCSQYLARDGGKLSKAVHVVPKEIDEQVARLALSAMGAEIDELTAEQEKYLASWREGT